MAACRGRFYFDGQAFRSAVLFGEEAFSSGRSFYEVMRVMGGACIFMEDHILRLQQSAGLSGLSFPFDPQWIYDTIRTLISRNRLLNGNIKLVLNFNGNNQAALYACLVPYSYPGPSLYRKGIDTALFSVVRGDPNVKRIIPAVQQPLREFISRKKIYEALLVDANGNITEGSRSNVFFIRGETLYTAPGKMVLKGITREKVIELCKTLNYKVIETPVSINTLNKMDSAFLTGTSPMILPIRTIGLITFMPVNQVMDRLRNAYAGRIEDYISAALKSTFQSGM
ncbi:MAG TPA: aminotransferase class IV [Bacteroidales bacterium]|nr:aminotransferase class IV [Bacteroidales bacterium]